MVKRGWHNGRELESRLCHLCVLLLAGKTCAHTNEHGVSWVVRTLERASPLGVCVSGWSMICDGLVIHQTFQIASVLARYPNS